MPRKKKVQLFDFHSVHITRNSTFVYLPLSWCRLFGIEKESTVALLKLERDGIGLKFLTDSGTYLQIPENLYKEIENETDCKVVGKEMASKMAIKLEKDKKLVKILRKFVEMPQS